jgi:hypothetical protein
MVFLETYCIETGSLQQQLEIRECLMANMDEVEVQAEDSTSGNTQLVSFGFHISQELCSSVMFYVWLTSIRLKDCDVTWLYGPFKQETVGHLLPTLYYDERPVEKQLFC